MKTEARVPVGWVLHHNSTLQRRKPCATHGSRLEAPPRLTCAVAAHSPGVRHRMLALSLGLGVSGSAARALQRALSLGAWRPYQVREAGAGGSKRPSMLAFLSNLCVEKLAYRYAAAQPCRCWRLGWRKGQSGSEASPGAAREAAGRGGATGTARQLQPHGQGALARACTLCCYVYLYHSKTCDLICLRAWRQALPENGL